MGEKYKVLLILFEIWSQMPAYVWLQCAWAQLMGRWAGSEGVLPLKATCVCARVGGVLFSFWSQDSCSKTGLDGASHLCQCPSVPLTRTSAAAGERPCPEGQTSSLVPSAGGLLASYSRPNLICVPTISMPLFLPPLLFGGPGTTGLARCVGGFPCWLLKKTKIKTCALRNRRNKK